MTSGRESHEGGALPVTCHHRATFISCLKSVQLRSYPFFHFFSMSPSMANHDKMRIWESWLHSEAFLLPTVRVCRRWPVRESRPVVEKLQGKEALLTCERVPWTEHLLRAKTLWAGLVKSCDPFDVLADLYINRNGAAMVDSIFQLGCPGHWCTFSSDLGWNCSCAWSLRLW